MQDVNSNNGDNGVIFSKVYKSRNLSFKVDLYSTLQMNLTRLPAVDYTTLEDYDDMHQMCSVVNKECIPQDYITEENDSVEANIELFLNNAGIESKKYVVVEYVGRDCASENLHPDTAVDGFLEDEIAFALQMLDEDKELNKCFLRAAYAKMLDKVINRS